MSKTCQCCDKTFVTKSKSHKDINNINYCSITCCNILRSEQSYKDWISDKVNITRNTTLKKYLVKYYGHICSVCTNSLWNGKPIALEVEHRDGNSSHNNFNNLCLICPNCHAQTDTYKSKNIGNGRHFRMQRYKEGKSY